MAKRGAVALSVLALAALFATSPPVLSAEPQAWPQDQWNPHPAPDDVVVRGPCGSRFAFRRIDTPVEPNWLADIRVRLGDAQVGSGATPSAQFVRFGHVAGGLTQTNAPDDRYYLVGKYEITRGQFAAVMEPECPQLDWRSAIALDATVWHDAVDFTRRLSEWVGANAAEDLPSAGDSRAFVRLPTEAEWEFAARGGAAVSIEERRASVFPTGGASITEFAMVSGSDSCAGEVQPIGMAKPNPLGLYDVLGNVQEYVSDPYRGTSAEQRPHGQVGGALAKGGSCVTDRNSLSSGMRVETRLFSSANGAANAAPFTGFRLAVSAQALTGPARVRAFNEDWLKTRQTIATAAGDGPAEVLRGLAAQSADPLQAQRLADVAAEFDRELAERRARETRSARTAATTGALTIRSYREQQRNILSAQILLQRAPESGQVMLERAERAAQLSRDIYSNLLAQTADDFSAAVINEQASLAADELGERYPPVPGTGALASLALLFRDQALMYQRDAPSDLDNYFDALAAAPDQLPTWPERE